MAAAGIPVEESAVVRGDFQEPRGYAATLELLALPERPTAIFASSDTAAFGVLRAARDQGLSVPRDLSVVGFDDILEASYVGAALSTVRQPLREMGRVAVSRLMRLIEDPSLPAERIVLDTELVVRETTAHPPTPAAGRRSGRARPRSRALLVERRLRSVAPLQGC
jgi:LacI family transcriptional regulator